MCVSLRGNIESSINFDHRPLYPYRPQPLGSLELYFVSSFNDLENWLVEGRLQLVKLMNSWRPIDILDMPYTLVNNLLE